VNGASGKTSLSVFLHALFLKPTYVRGVLGGLSLHALQLRVC
jgi:hypothetical protein